MRAITFLLIILAVAVVAEQPAVAIVEFEAKNCDAGIAEAVGEIMRTEIIATGKYRVIERAQLARVMEEHALQMSGLVDTSTIAELGKLVGADFVAVGSVSGLGGTYTISVRYIDVETAEAVLGRTETATNEAELPGVCRKLAAALTGLPYSGSSGDSSYSSSSSASGRIAFMSDRDGDGEIFVMDTDGGNQTQLTFNSSYDWSPDWSPDGRRIAFGSNRDGDAESFVMDADGGNQTQLTYPDSNDFGSNWSPDGSRCVLSSYSDGDEEIFVMERGRIMTQLTNSSGVDTSPSWSPDGRRIVFISYRTGDAEIFVMDADGGNQTQLTNNDDWDSSPTWSPDGRRIAFQSLRDWGWEIYVMDADGRNQTQLTNNSSNDQSPDWCPVE